jgi:hypothetical protein
MPTLVCEVCGQCVDSTWGGFEEPLSGNQRLFVAYFQLLRLFIEQVAQAHPRFVQLGL